MRSKDNGGGARRRTMEEDNRGEQWRGRRRRRQEEEAKLEEEEGRVRLRQQMYKTVIHRDRARSKSSTHLPLSLAVT